MSLNNKEEIETTCTVQQWRKKFLKYFMKTSKHIYIYIYNQTFDTISQL